MTIDRHCMRGLALGLSLLAEAGLAQTAGAPMGGAQAGVAPAPVIQPAAGGQVGQPPANSAMRRAGSTGAAGSAAPNPMGMAGMSLSVPGGGGGAASAGAYGTTGASGMSGGGATRGDDGMGRADVRITDSGITERPSGGGGSNR